MGAGGQAWVSKTGNALDTLPYFVSTIGLTMMGLEKKFEMKAVRWLANAILGLVFANTVFHKGDILLIFEAEFTESVVKASFATFYYPVLTGIVTNHKSFRTGMKRTFLAKIFVVRFCTCKLKESVKNFVYSCNNDKVIVDNRSKL